MASVALASQDDAASPHLERADEIHVLAGTGPAAYLDADAIVEAARQTGCDLVHPGYGFVSESADFARRCAAADLTFVGPSPETLEALGDKAAARALAERIGVPVLPGVGDVVGARALLDALGEGGAVMLKAVAGGGGRGLRRVTEVEELADAWERCASEARAAFGNDALYAERCLPSVRHVEVQVVGDATGALCHLFERECSLQRRHQKLVEIAPSPNVTPELRDQLTGAALRLAKEVGYLGVGTFEFLVAVGDEGAPEWYFLEANPRLQVEHTVTECVTGVDLVQTQLRIARGESLPELGLGEGHVAALCGYALQARVYMETLGKDGSVRPGGGTLAVYEVPSGPGLRVDGFARAGYTTNPRFDPLLAKLIVHSPSSDFAAVVRRAQRALAEFRIEGTATNLAFLRSLLSHPDVLVNRVTTRFVEENLARILRDAEAPAIGAVP